jgi:uncharacterized protein YegJ (DUF2314 family)
MIRLLSARNLALLVLSLMPLAGCSESGGTDPFVPIEFSSEDAEMNAAIAKARSTLPSFWKAFEARAADESGYALKVRITDQHGTEHLWLTNIERSGGETTGLVDNEPTIVKAVKRDDRIVIPDADISDWMYMRSGKIVGNETMKPMLKRLPKEKADQLRGLMAEP